MKFEATVRDKTYTLDFNESLTSVDVNETVRGLKFLSLGGNRFLLRMGRKTFQIDNVTKTGQTVEFTLNNVWHSVDIIDEQAILLKEMGFQSKGSDVSDSLTAPMPGKILDILVDEGKEVKQGDPLIILEAMKMENELKAPIDGFISAILVEKGTSVNKKEILIELKAIG
ncbi:MAG: acetyl-CoA carboxylase biotin carboxyl carrier protein subunit [Balneolales bacterium]